MKNLLYILSIIIGLLFTACQDDDFSISKIEEGGEVTLTFSVTIPEAQKASSRSFNQPSIKSLFLVVFEGGYRVETRKASPVNGWSATSGNECLFKVTLNETPNARTIHFIANYFDETQKEDNALGTGTEVALIGNLMTDIKADKNGNVNTSPEVFWQRINFSNGIIDNDETKKLLKKVPLIRNFTQISAKIATDENNTSDKFVLEGFAVINPVDQGYIAPYNNLTGEFDSFGSISSGNDGIVYNATTYENMGYMGRVPSTASVLTTSITDEGDGGLTFSLNPYYMFERKFEESDENHTYVLIKGKYNKQSSSYYKVALTYRDENDNPHNYNLLRNFNYVITINNVTGDGKPSAKEAAAMTGSHNDLSASVETKSYTNISDGYSRFFVSFTDTTLVDNTPIKLKFKYIPDITNSSTVNNNVKGFNDNGLDDDDENAADNIVDYVTIPNLNGNVISSYTISNANDPAPNSDWRTITITPNQVTQLKKQSITLFAGNLSRTINFTLRPKETMNVVCNPKIVAKEAGKAVNVNIQIPDNISETLFPLEFNIEAVERTLSSTLPVWTGTSITGNGKATFGYTKELTWEQYTELKENDSDKTDGIVTISCPFTTNIASNASYVYVTNKYFETDYDYFLNNSKAIVDNAYYGIGREVVFVYTAEVAGDYKFEAVNAEFDSNSRANVTTKTVSLAAGELYETILRTTSWSGVTSVKVTGTEETIRGNTERNKLAMKAISAIGESLEETTMLRIYLNGDNAINGTECLGSVMKNTLVTSNDGELFYAGLGSDTNLYFAYEYESNIYMASTTAGDLNDGEANLLFEMQEKPLEITASLSPTTVDLGTGKSVKLTLEFNKAGKASINAQRLTYASTSAGTVTGTDSNITFTAPSAGQYTITFNTADAVRGGTVTINNNDGIDYSRKSFGSPKVSNGPNSSIDMQIKMDDIPIGSCRYSKSNKALQNINFNYTDDDLLTNGTIITITSGNYRISTTIGNLIAGSNLKFSN